MTISPDAKLGAVVAVVIAIGGAIWGSEKEDTSLAKPQPSLEVTINNNNTNSSSIDPIPTPISPSMPNKELPAEPLEKPKDKPTDSPNPLSNDFLVTNPVNDFIQSVNEKIRINGCQESKYGFFISVGSIQENKESIKLTLSTKGNFKPSGYFLSETYQKACLVQNINIFIREVKKYKGIKNILTIDGKFYGFADGMGNKRVGKYRGEFGHYLPLTVTINGEEKPIIFNLGQSITNNDLAILRAYSIFDAFSKLARNNLLEFETENIKYIAQTVKGKGWQYRVAEIELIAKISPSNKH